PLDGVDVVECIEVQGKARRTPAAAIDGISAEQDALALPVERSRAGCVARRMHHGQSNVATEVDHIALLQAPLDTPFAPEHLQLDRFTLWNLIRLAHEAKRVAAVLLEVFVAVGQLRVGAVDVD